MRFSIIGLFLVMSMLSFTSLAQLDHGHTHDLPPVTQDVAEIRAMEIVTALTEKDMIDKSWNSIQVSTIEQKMFDGHTEWVVTFQNDSIEDMAKRTLYVFLTLGGEYTGANYTGQ